MFPLRLMKVTQNATNNSRVPEVVPGVGGGVVRGGCVVVPGNGVEGVEGSGPMKRQR